MSKEIGVGMHQYRDREGEVEIFMSIKKYLVAAVTYTFGVHTAIIVYGYLIIYFGEEVTQLRFVFIGMLGFCGLYSLSIFHKIKKTSISKREGIIWILSCSTLFSLFTYGVSLALDSSSYLAFTIFGGFMSLLVLSAVFFFMGSKLSSSLK